MISFRSVSKRYATGHTALDEVSFTIEAGEFVFLLGPSGSGKTTILKLLLKETNLTSGQILLANHDLGTIKRSDIPKLRRQIGAAFRDFKLLPDKTAMENVSLVLDILGFKKDQIIAETTRLLEKVGLSGKLEYFPSQLSGGEIQRVAIARALAANPVLLFADEPTGNLDKNASEQIVDLLEQINREGTTVIMSTHDETLAKKHGHRRIVIHMGKISEDSKPQSKQKHHEVA